MLSNSFLQNIIPKMAQRCTYPDSNQVNDGITCPF